MMCEDTIFSQCNRIFSRKEERSFEPQYLAPYSHACFIAMFGECKEILINQNQTSSSFFGGKKCVLEWHVSLTAFWMQEILEEKEVGMFDCAYLAIHHFKISNLDNKQVPLQTMIELCIAGRVG